jgi:hypothetical protein
MTDLELLRPWQEDLMGMMRLPPQPNGSVHLVVGESGVGKTAFSKYATLENNKECAILMPPAQGPQDMAFWCKERGPQRCYIVDFPTNAYKLQIRNPYWEAISSMKDGKLAGEEGYGPATVIIFFGPKAKGLDLSFGWGEDFHILRVDKKTMKLQDRLQHDVAWDPEAGAWKRLPIPKKEMQTCL